MTVAAHDRHPGLGEPELRAHHGERMTGLGVGGVHEQGVRGELARLARCHRGAHAGARVRLDFALADGAPTVSARSGETKVNRCAASIAVRVGRITLRVSNMKAIVPPM